MLGTTFKVKKEHRTALKTCVELLEKADVLLDAGASKRKSAHERLWKLINEIYPETKDYECSFNHKKFEIITIRKLKNWEVERHNEG